MLDKYAAARPLLLDLVSRQEAAAAAATSADAAGHEAQEQGAARRPGRQSSKRARQEQQQQQQQQRHQQQHQQVSGRGGRMTRSAAAQASTHTAPAAAAACEEIDLLQDSSESDASSERSSEGDDDDWSDGGASSPSPKRRRGAAPRPRSSIAQRGGAAAAAAAATAAPPPVDDTPPGFVRCPVCSKTVPGFYINSHVDQCLAGTASDAPAAAGGHEQQQRRQQQQAGPFEPLAVPAKLVPSLATEKSLRQLMKRYSLPTEGKKKVGHGAGRAGRQVPLVLDVAAAAASWLLGAQTNCVLCLAIAARLQELLERYSKMRLAVEMANDKQVCAGQVLAEPPGAAPLRNLEPSACCEQVCLAGWRFT